VSSTRSRAERALNYLSVLFGLIAAVGAIRIATGYPESPFLATDRSSDVPSLANIVPSQTVAQLTSVALVLRSDCHFCQESAPFHRWLAENSAVGVFRVLVLTDEPSAQLEATLNAKGIRVASVQHVDLSRIGLSGTPSIVVFSASGDVQKVWRGVLSSEKQFEVASFLGLHLTDAIAQEKVEQPAPRMLEIEERELAEYSIPGSGKYIVDTRPRSQFEGDRVPGSLNIPIEELKTRAIHELRPGADVLLYCDYSECEASLEAKGISTRCTLATTILQSAGFNARALKVGLSSPES
jgi:hypothetical protein